MYKRQPDLVDAGIDSFKIEGRMKKPEYVAGVTSMYRKYTDLYLRKGRAGFKVLPEDREMPVSYTHLDVYKRQRQNCLIQPKSQVRFHLQ